SSRRQEPTFHASGRYGPPVWGQSLDERDHRARVAPRVPGVPALAARTVRGHASLRIAPAPASSGYEGPPVTGRLPLSALLSRSMVALSAAYRRAGAGTHPNPSLAMWWTLLTAVTVDGSPEAELQQRTCVSRRALRSSL